MQLTHRWDPVFSLYEHRQTIVLSLATGYPSCTYLGEKKNPFIFAFHMTEGWRYVPPKRKMEKNEKSRGARTGLVHRVTGMTSVLNLGGLHKVRKIRKTKNKNIEKYKKSLTLFFKRLIFLTCSNIPRTLHPVGVLMAKYELLAYKHIRS